MKFRFKCVYFLFVIFQATMVLGVPLERNQLYRLHSRDFKVGATYILVGPEDGLGHTRREFYVHGFEVSNAQERKRGHGRAHVLNLLRLARDHREQFDALTLFAAYGSRPFWQRMGFRSIGNANDDNMEMPVANLDHVIATLERGEYALHETSSTCCRLQHPTIVAAFVSFVVCGMFGMYQMGGSY